MADASRQQLLALCRNVLAPMLRADEGELYIVSVDDNELIIHLAGTCSGCPGAGMTIRSVIEPAVRQLSEEVRLIVTVGAKMPPGALRAEPPEKGTSEG